MENEKREISCDIQKWIAAAKCFVNKSHNDILQETCIKIFCVINVNEEIMSFLEKILLMSIINISLKNDTVTVLVFVEMWSLDLIIIEITDYSWKTREKHVPNIDIYPIDKNSLPSITSETCKWGRLRQKMNYYQVEKQLRRD